MDIHSAGVKHVLFFVIVYISFCFAGFTLLAFMKATPIASGDFQGFISSIKTGSAQPYGAALVGQLNKIA